MGAKAEHSLQGEPLDAVLCVFSCRTGFLAGDECG